MKQGLFLLAKLENKVPDSLAVMVILKKKKKKVSLFSSDKGKVKLLVITGQKGHAIVSPVTQQAAMNQTDTFQSPGGNAISVIPTNSFIFFG